MDGRTDGQTDGRTDRRKNGRTVRQTDRQTGPLIKIRGCSLITLGSDLKWNYLIFQNAVGRTDGRTDRWTNGWKDGRTDGWTDGLTYLYRCKGVSKKKRNNVNQSIKQP